MKRMSMCGKAQRSGRRAIRIPVFLEGVGSMRSGFIGLVLLGLVAGSLISPMTARAQISPAVSPSSALTIPQDALLQPADVVKLLQGGVRPVIFQVGSHLMFSQAHIPGSVYAGPG